MTRSHALTLARSIVEHKPETIHSTILWDLAQTYLDEVREHDETKARLKDVTSVPFEPLPTDSW